MWCVNQVGYFYLKPPPPFPYFHWLLLMHYSKWFGREGLKFAKWEQINCGQIFAWIIYTFLTCIPLIFYIHSFFGPLITRVDSDTFLNIISFTHFIYWFLVVADFNSIILDSRDKTGVIDFFTVIFVYDQLEINLHLLLVCVCKVDFFVSQKAFLLWKESCPYNLL